MAGAELLTQGTVGLVLACLVIFFAMLLEALPAIGLLIPGQTLVVGTAFLAAEAGVPPWWLVGAAAAGGATGDFASYWAGRRYGPALLLRLPKRLRPGTERIEKNRTLMGHHGIKVVLLGRFQPITRSFGPFFAGVARMPITAFSLANVASSLAMSALLVGAGYLAGLGFRHATAYLGYGLLWGFLGAIALFALYWAVTSKLRLVRRGTLTAMLLACVGIPSFLELAHEIGRRHFFVLWEERLWTQVEPLIPWDLHEAMWSIAWAGNIYVVGAAGMILFLALAMLRRWRDAYMALAIGPVTAGLALLATAVVQRAAPYHDPPFAPFGSFPSHGAALFPPLVAFVAWLAFRERTRGPLVSAVLAVAAAIVVTVTVAPFFAGQAWPTDILGGWLLGASIFGLAYVGHRLIDTLTSQAPTPRTTRFLDAWSRWTVRPRVRRLGAFLHGHIFERPTALVALIAFGVAATIASYWTQPLGIDANRYAVMGESFRLTQTFTMPWGDVYSPGTGPQPSHHYPPLYPMVLAAFFAVFGFQAATVHLAAVCLALLAMLVTYACSRDLYGHRKALVATAVVAIAPAVIQNTGKGYSESLVLGLFVATLWAILKSLERPGFIVPAGALAALSYLTKSSMGYFFIIAGLGGLAWRLYWKGFKVLRDKYYAAAIALFGSAVLAWAWRNWRLFQSWETSDHLTAAYQFAFHAPLTWLLRSTLTFGFMLVMGYFLFLGLLPWLPRFIRFPKLETEHDSGLWLSIGLPLILTAVIDAALWMYEGPFFFNNVRYVSFVIVPLAWLILRNVPWDRASKVAATMSLLILLGISIGFVATPHHPAAVGASHALGALVGEGDSVAFVGITDVYRFYFDATKNGDRQVVVTLDDESTAGARNPDWIVAQPPGNFASDGYQLVSTHRPDASPGAHAIAIWRLTKS